MTFIAAHESGAGPPHDPLWDKLTTMFGKKRVPAERRHARGLMDAAAIQSVIASRLPQRARWRIGNDTQDFSLHSDPCSLAAEFAKWGLTDADLTDIEHGSDLIVFGMWNYNEGGGARPALVVRQSDGKVYGVDVEANDPLFVLNSSLEAFIDTFCLLDKYLGHGQPIPADLNLLVRNLDPTVYSESDWRDLVDHVAGL